MNRPLHYLLHLLPDSAGTAFVMSSAAIATRMALKPRDREALARGQALRWGPRGRHRAWAWGSGPTVLLFHGWGGMAAQMAPLAEHLAWLGFTAVAPDLGAHGASPGWRRGFDRLIDDIGAFHASRDAPIHAAVGHSAGGMAMMAARARGRLRAGRYACLNTPLYPYPPIRTIRQTAAPRESVLERCQTRFIDQFGAQAPGIRDGGLFIGDGSQRLLVLHDTDDPQVDIADGETMARRLSLIHI